MKAKKIKKLIKEIKNSKISHKKQIKSNKKIKKFLKNLNRPPIAVEDLVPITTVGELKRRMLEENNEVESVIIKKYIVNFKNGEVISGYYTEDEEYGDEDLSDISFEPVADENIPPTQSDLMRKSEAVAVSNTSVKNN